MSFRGKRGTRGPLFRQNYGINNTKPNWLLQKKSTQNNDPKNREAHNQSGLLASDSKEVTTKPNGYGEDRQLNACFSYRLSAVMQFLLLYCREDVSSARDLA